MFTPVSSKSLTASGEANSVCHLLLCDFFCWPSKYFLASISAQTNLFHSTFSNWWKLWTVRMNFLYTSRKRSARVLCLRFNLKFCLDLLYICILEKNKYVIYWLRVGPYREKLCPRSWMCGPQPAASVRFLRPRAHFFSIRSSQPVNNVYLSYDPYGPVHAILYSMAATN